MKLLDNILNKRSLRKYIAGLIVYGGALWMINHLGFYTSYLRQETLSLFAWMYKAYVVLGWPINELIKDNDSKSLDLLSALRKFPSQLYYFSYGFILKKNTEPAWNKKEELAVRFAVVKLFYAPLMVNFFFGNFSQVKNVFVSGSFFDLFVNFRYRYSLIITMMLSLDTLIFAFGYLFEASFLKNKLRSVEPTILGWVVALATYPPFNDITGRMLSWHSKEYFYFQDPVVDYPLKIMIVAAMGIYVWATFSLGTKASNLTNRGIVSSGAYKYIRHPAYAGKLFAWWMMMLPGFSLAGVASLACWTMIYYLRAITEERHLARDPEYIEYIKVTKYRFIPGVI